MRVRVQVDEYREFGLVTRGEHAGGELVFARLSLVRQDTVAEFLSC